MHPDLARRLSILALVTLLGCVLNQPVPIEHGVNLAAHAAEHNRIVLDRLPDGRAGMIEAASWFNLGRSSPTYLVNADHETIAALWLTAPATVQVRAERSPGAPVVGGVEPSWEDNTIRLALRSATDGVFQSDVFQRTMIGGGPSALTRSAQTILDVRGTYRAALHDAKGTEAGWLRVRITPYGDAFRVYDGVLPAGVGPGLAAAAVVALNSEIDWIENHTVDVYRGADGPLRESMPMGR